MLRVFHCLRYFIAVLVVGLMMNCAGEDDLGLIGGTNPISRMYISTSDYDAGAVGDGYHNIYIVDPADYSGEGKVDTSLTSGASGGLAIYFNAFAQRIFQSGINDENYIDTTIRILYYDKDSLITPIGTIGNRKFTQISGIAYNSLDDQLFVVNNAQEDNTNSSYIFVLNSPKSGSGFKRPAYEVALDYRPWAMQLDSLDLYISKEGKSGGLVVYKGFANRINNMVDTLVTMNPSYTLTVNAAQNIKGMAFNKRANTLILTDYDDEGENGRILLFENFFGFSNSATITPTRIITGSSTLLRMPVNVAVDSRPGAEFLYVADAKSKLILRFRLSDNGNITPNDSFAVGTVSGGNTPMSISLDARGIPAVN